MARGYDGNVRDRLYEVRSANEKKDFKKALELAEKIAAKEEKLYGGNEESASSSRRTGLERWEAEKDGVSGRSSRAPMRS